MSLGDIAVDMHRQITASIGRVRASAKKKYDRGGLAFACGWQTMACMIARTNSGEEV
jgi:hypothetical protein